MIEIGHDSTMIFLSYAT